MCGRFLHVVDFEPCCEGSVHAIAWVRPVVNFRQEDLDATGGIGAVEPFLEFLTRGDVLEAFLPREEAGLGQSHMQQKRCCERDHVIRGGLEDDEEEKCACEY